MPRSTSPKPRKRIIPASDAIGAGTYVEPERGAGLPPAGYSRNEELNKRYDNLQEAAETRSATYEHYAGDPAKLKPIREIQQHFNEFNELSISNADPAYQYCWANCNHSSGIFIRFKMAQGWQVVNGDAPEATEHRHVDGTRRVGDVMLMRIRLDRWMALERERKAKNRRADEAVSANLREMGEKYRDKGVIVHTPEDGTMDERLMQRMATNATAKARAGAMTDKWVREGSMPGVPGPGRDR